jgi:hypothetical protein
MKTRRWLLVPAGGVVCLAIAACDAPDTYSGGSGFVPFVPMQLATGACGPTPGVLAHLPGAESRTIAVDDANVYVVASRGGDRAREQVWRVPKTGAPPDAVSGDGEPVGDISVGQLGISTVLAWTTGSCAEDAGPSGGVWKLEGNSAVRLAGDRIAPGAILVEPDGRVVWAERQIDETGRACGAVVSTAVAGGDGVALLAGTAVDRAPHTFDFGHLQDPELFWTTADPAKGNDLSADVMGLVLPVPSTPAQIAGGACTGASAIETDCDGSLFFGGPHGIVRVTSDGARSFVATGGFVQWIEDDCAAVYYVDPATRQLMTVALDAAEAAPRSLAAGVDPTSAFEVDTACVYWVDAEAQDVMMVHW